MRLRRIKKSEKILSMLAVVAVLGFVIRVVYANSNYLNALVLTYWCGYYLFTGISSLIGMFLLLVALLFVAVKFYDILMDDNNDLDENGNCLCDQT